MKYSIYATLVLAIGIVIPNSAFAVIQTSSDVLATMNNIGNPREFSVQFNQYTANEESTMWINGVQEGKAEYYKMKADVVLHKSANGETTKLHTKMMVFQNKQYVKIQDWTVEKNGVLSSVKNNMVGVWGVMPVQSSTHKSHPIGALSVMSNMNDPMNVTFLWETMTSLTTMLPVEFTSFDTGYAYSIKGKIQDKEMHIRMNTDKNDAFLFGKFYITLGNRVMQGKVQNSGERTYLSIPKDPIDATLIIKVLHKTPYPTVNNKYSMQSSEVTQKNQQVEKKVTALIRSQIIMPDYTQNKELAENEEALVQYNTEKFNKALTYKRSSLVNRNTSSKRVQRNTYAWRNNRNDFSTINAYTERAKHDAFTEEFAYAASRSQTHILKSMISTALIKEKGETGIGRWATEIITPFFKAVDKNQSSTVLNTLVAKDGNTGEVGLLVHKSISTLSGLQKDYTVFVIDEKNRPRVRDFFPNMSPQDIGVRRNGDQIVTRSNIDFYSHWEEKLVIDFDNRDWQLSHTKELEDSSVMQYRLPGQSYNAWEEKVTVEKSIDTMHSTKEALISFVGKLTQQCPEMEWNLLKDTESNILIEWFGDCADLPTQHEIRRFFRANNRSVYSVAYTGKTYKLDSGVRTIWIDILEKVHVDRKSVHSR
ncbi:MAG: hypothetical protein O3A81_04120 [bacterium]|nr:hypothetical protein [bacterium]